MSTRRRALELAASLHDVQQPASCPTCFNFVVAELHPMDHTAKMPLLEELRDHHPEFWDACITFVTAPRADADLPALRRLLLANTQKCPSRRYHEQKVRSNYTDPIHVLVEACYIALHSCFSMGRNRMVHRRKAPSRFGGKGGRWPTAIDQLAPFGELRSVESHVYWCSKRFSTAPLVVLDLILQLARPVAFPHLIAEPLHGKIVYILCQMLHGSPGVVPEGWDGDAPILPAADPTLPLALPKQERLQLHAATDFIDCINRGLDCHIKQDNSSFVNGYRRALFFATHAAASKIDPEHPGFLTLCQYASLTYRDAGVPMSFVSPRVQAAWEARKGDSNGLDMARVTYQNLVQLGKLRSCCGPGCDKTVLATGRAFASCARCKSVRYCGPECQKRDWTYAPEHRHKDVCPLLCQLLSVGNLDMGTDEWRTAFQSALDAGEQWKLYRWAVAGPLFSEGTRRRMTQCLENMVRAQLSFRTTE